MQKFLVVIVQEYKEFRYADIESIAKTYDIPIKIEPFPAPQDDQLIYLYAPTEQDVIKIAQRCVNIKYVLDVITSGKTFQDVATATVQYFQENAVAMEPYLKPSFRISVETCGRKLPQTEQIEMVKQYKDVQWEGKVDLLNPKVEFFIVGYYGFDTSKGFYFPLQFAFFTRKVVKGARHLIVDYELPKRKYIGTTSMTATLSFFVANQAMVKEGSLVMDPFVGTGSLLVACAHMGAKVLGGDLDARVLNGKDGKNIATNFVQYNLASKAGLDVVRADMSFYKHTWRMDGLLDAIVGDVPYGHRAGAKKVGREEYKPVPEEFHNRHYVSHLQYGLDELMQDLLDFAYKALRLNGRLVFWIPTNVKDVQENTIPLPKHDCLKLIYVCTEQLTIKRARTLITMEKYKN